MRPFGDRDLEFALEVVAQAAALDIVPRFRALSVADVAHRSSSIDLVTEADLRAEQRIADTLVSRFPQTLIVAVERYEADPSVIEALRHAELAFVIDPVDGTCNFAAGLPAFATILAVVSQEETIAGLIYDCISGDHLLGLSGSGAHLARADGRSTQIAAAPAAPIERMIGTSGWAFMKEPARSRIASNMSKVCMPFTVNCSAYEYWLASTGHLHFIAHGRATLWDHLAGVLIHHEAGGFAAKLDGTPCRPGDVEGGILCAPDRESWATIPLSILA